MRKMLSIIALTFAACAVYAQGFYYQSTMPDGSIIVGDKPAPGAKSVRQIPLRSGNIAAPVRPPPQAGPVPGADVAPGAESSEPDVRTAQAVATAQKRLDDAARRNSAR